MNARRLDALVVGALCLAAFAQALSSLRQKSLTFDELTYIPSGYSYVVTGDYRLNPEHPPLAKLMAGAALLAAPSALLAARPALDTLHSSWGSGDQWAFGAHFFDEAGSDTPHLATVARLPTVLLLLVLVVGAYRMGRELYGRRAGLLAAWLCAFSPNLLAHGRLATTDLPQACFVLLTSYAALRYVRRPSPGGAVGVGVVLALALLSKYSAILLLGLVPLWLAAGGLTAEAPHAGDAGGPGRAGVAERFPWPERSPRVRAAAFVAASLLGMLAVAAIVVGAAYGTPGNPAAFVRNLGALYTNVHLDLPAYFAGRFHDGAVPWYFAAAFLLKAPTAFLVLLGLRAADQIVRRDADLPGTLHLLLPALVWLVAMTLTALPFGIRYVLPIYPLLFVYASGLVASPYLPGHRVRPWVVAGLAGLFALSSLWARPHYLPYFNALAGGPDRGIEWLDDSNVDWGQDLPALREWLDERGITDATVVPMALYDPALYGVRGRVRGPAEVLSLLTAPDPPPGVYAISAHLLTRARWSGPPLVDPLRDIEPAAVLGHSIYVFDLRLP